MPARFYTLTTTTTTTSTTTTTTTFNINNYACVAVGPDEDSFAGTYVVTGTSTVGGVTRSVYTNVNPIWTIQLASAVGGPVWAFYINGVPTNTSTTQPAPTYPWQATGYNLDLRSFTQGPC
jgi:hypothetical protein